MHTDRQGNVFSAVIFIPFPLFSFEKYHFLVNWRLIYSPMGISTTTCPGKGRRVVFLAFGVSLISSLRSLYGHSFQMALHFVVIASTNAHI